MNRYLQGFLIISLFVFLLVILHFLTKKKLNLKYTLVWLIADVAMMCVVIFPGIIDWVSEAIGIAAPVNSVFLLAGMFAILIIFTLTIIVSHINERIYRLVQMQAILERQVRTLNKRINP